MFSWHVSKCLQQMHIVHNVVGHVETSVPQQSPTRDAKELITTSAAQELPSFTIKGFILLRFQ